MKASTHPHADYARLSVFAGRDGRVCEQAPTITYQSTKSRDDQVERRRGSACHKDLAIAEIRHLHVDALAGSRSRPSVISKPPWQCERKREKDRTDNSPSTNMERLNVP